ncbi:GntT/GntP/DsdX family permease [Streptomyces sp. W16]|uniref:GntT/GntP/DsdX family permease n=1 Tax=Streptomyces sp. W16 TaxID=3076631 RepID=UPI003FA3DBC1
MIVAVGRRGFRSAGGGRCRCVGCDGRWLRLGGLDLRLARQRRCPRAERADGCSWMVAKYFGISERDTLKTWTVLESVLSVAGFAVAALLSVFV